MVSCIEKRESIVLLKDLKQIYFIIKLEYLCDRQSALHGLG